MAADLRAETPTYLPTRPEGMVIYPGHETAPAQQEAQSQICWPLHHLQASTSSSIQDSFHVSLLKPHHNPVPVSTEPGQTEEPPLPLILDEGTVYKVKEILESRRRGGQLEYIVDWEGYGPEERSWVPRNNILDPSLLEEFHAAHPDRPAPRGRGRPPRHRGIRPSGAGRGGGGTAMERPGSTATQSQWSLSPEFWAPAPVTHSITSTASTKAHTSVSTLVRSRTYEVNSLLEQYSMILTSCVLP